MNIWHIVKLFKVAAEIMQTGKKPTEKCKVCGHKNTNKYSDTCWDCEDKAYNPFAEKGKSEIEKAIDAINAPIGEITYPHDEDTEDFDLYKEHAADLPDDYEECGVCGYDHTYEPEEAHRAHKRMAIENPDSPESDEDYWKYGKASIDNLLMKKLGYDPMAEYDPMSDEDFVTFDENEHLESGGSIVGKDSAPYVETDEGRHYDIYTPDDEILSEEGEGELDPFDEIRSDVENFDVTPEDEEYLKSIEQANLDEEMLEHIDDEDDEDDEETE